MSHDHQVSEEAARSFSIKWKAGVPQVIASGWVVGYTPAHRPTPAEAIAYEMERAQADMSAASERFESLKMMLEEYRAQ